MSRDHKHRYKVEPDVEDALKQYPRHLVKLVNLIKSNADIRRYTSLGILNYLYQKGIYEKPNGYVTFKWTFFRVNFHGQRIDYCYTEPFFLNCLIASLSCFTNNAKKTINNYCLKELSEPFC